MSRFLVLSPRAKRYGFFNDMQVFHPLCSMLFVKRLCWSFADLVTNVLKLMEILSDFQLAFVTSGSSFNICQILSFHEIFVPQWFSFIEFQIQALV